MKKIEKNYLEVKGGTIKQMEWIVLTKKVVLKRETRTKSEDQY